MATFNEQCTKLKFTFLKLVGHTVQNVCYFMLAKDTFLFEYIFTMLFIPVIQT